MSCGGWCSNSVDFSRECGQATTEHGSAKVANPTGCLCDVFFQGEKSLLLLLPFAFVTLNLGKQMKSKSLLTMMLIVGVAHESEMSYYLYCAIN